MDYIEKKYSDKELLENTYFILTDNEAGGFCDVETVRLIKETDDSVYLLSCIMSPLINGTEVIYNPMIIDKAYFEENFVPAQEMMEDSFKYSMIKDGKTEQILFIKDSAIGFFRSLADRKIVMALDVEKNIDDYFASPYYAESKSGFDLEFAKEMVLDHIKTTKLYENDFINDFLLESLRKTLNVLVDPEDILSKEDQVTILKQVLQELKGGNYQLVKQNLDDYFFVMQSNPTVIATAMNYIKNKYNKEIHADPNNATEIENLDINAKKFLLQGFIEEGLEKGWFESKGPVDYTLSNEEEEFFEDYSFTMSQTLLQLQKHMGYANENATEYVDKYIRKEEKESAEETDFETNGPYIS